ncbi:MFS general substrate transporter [Lanmaoa asiatica]|nr:MFS general substrate transporter [Lanmaoa asiatica]
MRHSTFTDGTLLRELNGRKSPQTNTTQLSKKGLRFWLIFGTMCICLFMSALELFSVSTALPTIVNALHTSQFTWVGSAYALASTAFLPMSGGLAQTFGRRPTILLSICLFAIGSTVCGCANDMTILIAGRTMQGLGGGGIQALTGIILADLVTLQERGVYAGLFGLTWCLAASVGPIVGGTLAEHGLWRWIFYLNLPITLVACVLTILLLDLPIPQGSYREKFTQMDWIGTYLVISSTVAYTTALSWGGLTAPWSSATVLVPLVLGLLGLVVFIAYEATAATHPLVRASLCTFIQVACHSCQIRCPTLVIQHNYFADFLPVYFQACKGASPVQSGVYALALTAIAPGAIGGGLSVNITKRYRPQMWIAWVVTIIALGLMSTLQVTDPIGKSIGYLVLLGWATGYVVFVDRHLSRSDTPALTHGSVLNATPMYPIQAPLPVTQNAPALAFMWFTRSFSTLWGITIGSTVLQNELTKKVPASFIRSVPEGTAIMYALIPRISVLPPETRFEIQVAFAGSLAVLWRVLAAFGGVGLLASLFMKGLPLHNKLDEDWVLEGQLNESKVLNSVETTVTLHIK